MNISTCPVCDTQIQHIPDGLSRYCLCRNLGITCTSEYTRYMGIINKESAYYKGWANLYAEKLNNMRLRFNNQTHEITDKLTTLNLTQ